MLRTLALILIPLGLLAAACGGGSSSDEAVRDSGGEPGGVTRDAGPDGIYDTADDLGLNDAQDTGDQSAAPASVVDDSVTDADVSDDSDFFFFDDDAGVDDFVFDWNDSDADADDFVIDATDSGLDDNAIFGALNPMSFIGGLGSAPISGEIDAELGTALLTDADVPGDFDSLGEFSFSMPSEVGEMQMAARMWGRGMETDDFGAMIMSMAMVVPPEAMGELDELMGLTDEDLAELQGATGDFGLFADLRILNTDDLGEGGFGMHMEMDFGALLSAFGAPEEEGVPTGIIMDMYAFVVGDQVLMVMVMWPTGESPGVDAHALAETMESRT